MSAEGERCVIKFHEKIRVNDKVLIIGPYAGGSQFANPWHHRAMSWKGVVTRIIEGRNFPILVSRYSEPIGWFRASSLKVIEKAPPEEPAEAPAAPKKPEEKKEEKKEEQKKEEEKKEEEKGKGNEKEKNS